MPIADDSSATYEGAQEDQLAIFKSKWELHLKLT